MSGFLDVYLPDRIKSLNWTSSPRFSTTITAVANGAEHRNVNWKNPLHQFKSPEGVRCHEQLEQLLDHWMVMRGPAFAFPMRDPLDFASVKLPKANLAPSLTGADQVIGVGNGAQDVFQLVKEYRRGTFTFQRTIALPVVDSVIPLINALDPETSDAPDGPYTWSVDRLGGKLRFSHAPPAGAIITAGFLFDVPVRFMADDSFDRVVSAFQVDGFSDLDFQEIRPCFDQEVGS